MSFLSVCRSLLMYTHTYMDDTVRVYRSLLSVYRSLLSVYRSLLSVYRSLLSVHRSLLSVYLLSKLM